ncbi:MAG TPA: peptide chain release factor N(5)-glutamine methyltransferase [Candidatus Kryptobacter bacterium]|nr:MAG: protein-(glutamine-N5) methyltransferase, release factor-specific [Ignavibacteriae bacterium 37-53-5]HQT91126.1 peptide chain release factor N(5)-glutamine methyltransferase [Candidatus Kryptobacter bacterium]
MPVEEKVWTVIDIIRWGTGYLAEKGFDEARLTVELLLGETLGVKRFDLYVKHDQPLKKSELDQFKVLLKRRLSHEPVQYILGKTNFYSIELKVDKRALIPRPETEILAEAVIEHCRTFLSQKDVVRVLDVGTGSGCLAIAVAKFVKNSSVVAIDKSAAAIELAKENARGTGTEEKITFVQSDFLKLENNVFETGFDVIISNPPYIPESELASLAQDIRDFEPVDALSDGRDGMTFFRKISEAAPMLLRDGGWVFVETAYGQAKDVARIFSENGGTELLVKKDLSNIERVVRSRFFSSRHD